MDNILIVSDFSDIEDGKDSGTPTLKLIVGALAKKYMVHIISPSGKMQSGNNIIYHRILTNIIIHGESRLVKILNAKFFWYDFTTNAFKNALELNKQYNFKLVYGVGCNSVYVASRIGKYCKIPSIGRLLGTYLYSFLNNPIDLLLRFDETLAFKSNCTRFIITNDGTMGDKVAKHFHISSDRLYFWRNGVDIPPVCNKFSDGKIRIVSVARLQDWKRIDRIITAFHKASLLNDNILLTIVGGGLEERNLKQLVKDYNLESKITFTGDLPRVKALQMLGCADIFMSTNDYSNVSNSLMEAMACGKCIIALDTGGTSELINSDTGLLTKSENDLTSNILYACSKHIRNRLGINAEMYAYQYFESWESRISKEVEVCDGLINGRLK